MSSSPLFRHRLILLLALVAWVALAPSWGPVALLCVVAVVLMARVADHSSPAQREAANRDGIVLGADPRGVETKLSAQQVSAHGLIVGASGSGKTTTLLRILTERIVEGLPVVAIDMKGSRAFHSQLAGAAAAAGRPLRVWTLDGPSQWNPLQHGNPTELKDKLISTERFTEPHYQRAAERYVQTVLQVLDDLHPERSETLEEVVSLMEPQRLPGLLRGVSRPLADRVQDYLAALTPDQLSAIRGLGNRLAIITESSAGKYLAPASDTELRQIIDLHAALDDREVVLFSLNASIYGKLAAQLGTIVIQDLVSAMGHRLGGTPSAQAMIGIDEFSALGAEQVLSLLARARESGMPVMLATQELTDLERVARGMRDQVLGIIGLVIAHRQDVPNSAGLISKMAGMEKTWEDTYHTAAGLLLGDPLGSRRTRREVDRPVHPPEEIMTLSTGEALMISKVPVARTSLVRVSPPRVGRSSSPPSPP